jgi:hypothetical protein
VRYEKKIYKERRVELYAKQSMKNVAKSKGNWEFNCTITCNKDKCRLTEIVKIFVGCQPIMVK